MLAHGNLPNFDLGADDSQHTPDGTRGSIPRASLNTYSFGLWRQVPKRAPITASGQAKISETSGEVWIRVHLCAYGGIVNGIGLCGAGAM